MNFIPKNEITGRIKRLQKEIMNNEIDGILLFDRIQLLYYTGSIQDGFLFIPAEGEALYFIRRSIERAKIESPVEGLFEYRRFSDILPYIRERDHKIDKLGIDESSLVLSQYKRLCKTFPETEFINISLILMKQRAVKTPYEIEKIKRAAAISKEVNACIPELLRPGMTELEFGLKLFNEISMRSVNCFQRISNTTSGEFFLGHVCFGENSLYPSAFDTPNGSKGLFYGCPFLGSEKELKHGDLVFVDIAYSFEEYYVDKTRVFSLGQPGSLVLKNHALCCEIQQRIESLLTPGIVPEEIYKRIYKEVVIPLDFQENFMGYRGNQVKFLGHGIGLAIDEYPVIAEKFTEPLKENMVLAVEPKKALESVGMVGVENTFLITGTGCEKLTADRDEIVIV